MSKRSDTFYFDNFVKSISVSCQAAVMLKETLEDFDPACLREKLDRMHEIEHKGDECKHALVTEIAQAFITPIERDDIVSLSQSIDDVTDSIEDVLIHIYITNITRIRPDAIRFAELLIECCRETREMLEEFRSFKKSKKLKELIIEINHTEEEGDRMFVDFMHNLHATETDPILIFSWRKIYALFEKCFDVCEDVADIVESIVIGNS